MACNNCTIISLLDHDSSSLLRATPCSLHVSLKFCKRYDLIQVMIHNESFIINMLQTLKYNCWPWTKWNRTLFKVGRKILHWDNFVKFIKIAKKNICSCGGEVDLFQHQLATVTARIEQETKKLLRATCCVQNP